MRRRGKPNRKETTEGFALPVPLSGLIVLAVSVILGYVWIDCKCDALGEEIRRLETDLVELKKELNVEEYKWSTLKAPKCLELVLKRHKLPMGWARRDQNVRLTRVQVALTPPPAGVEQRLAYSSAKRSTARE
jgi:hypothetical protein